MEEEEDGTVLREKNTGAGRSGGEGGRVQGVEEEKEEAGGVEEDGAGSNESQGGELGNFPVSKEISAWKGY